MAEKNKALETALVQIEKKYGAGAVMRLGETRALQIEAISTGSLSLDIATGIGGLPRGRIVEIYGPNPPVKPPLRCMWSPKRKSRGAKRRSWMPSMRSTPFMPQTSA